MILWDRGPKPARLELRLFEALLVVLLGAVSVHVVVSESIPLMAAMAIGHPVALDRQIKGEIIGGRRSCPFAFKVNDPVFTVICNPPLKIPRSSEGGNDIHIEGYGTRLGIFWTSIKPLK